MASGVSGLRSEIAGKLKMNKKTKEASQMGPAYESTKTGLQYWEAVKVELEVRKNAYIKALKRFKDNGGTGSTEENVISVKLKDISGEVELDAENDNKMSFCKMHITHDNDPESLSPSSIYLAFGDEVQTTEDIKKVGTKLIKLYAVIGESESIKDTEQNIIILTNAIVAMFGLNGSAEAQRMAEELRSYLENDGYIKGMHNMANNHILEDSLLTAMSFIPEENVKERQKVEG